MVIFCFHNKKKLTFLKNKTKLFSDNPIKQYKIGRHYSIIRKHVFGGVTSK